jgi:hypothetical protein
MSPAKAAGLSLFQEEGGMVMRYTIDRITGNIAVCEDENGNMVKLVASELPGGVYEGDVLFKQDGTWYKDEEESSERRRVMEEKLNRLIE